MFLNTLLRRTIILGLLAVPFIPLIVSSSMFFPFITGKNFAFRIIVEIIFAAWVILAIRETFYRPNKSGILLAFAAFIGIIALADIFGENFYRSFWSNYERMEGLVAHLHLFAYFLVVSSVLKTEQVWERLLHVFLGSGILLFFYGIIQKTGGLVINQGGTRVDATFGNATYFAVYSLFILFLALYFLVRYSPERFGKAISVPIIGSLSTIFYSFILYFTRLNDTLALGGKSSDVAFFLGDKDHQAHLWFFLISFLILIICMPAYLLRDTLSLATKKAGAISIYSTIVFLSGLTIYFTQTRGAILGLIGGLTLFGFLSVVGNWHNSKVRNFSLGGLIGILAIIGLFLAFKDSDFVRHDQTLSRLASISLSETTTKSRFMVWGTSWQGFKERPILGWGQDNFIVVFSKYYNPGMWGQEPWFDRSHNVFFDWLIAGGSLGLLSYLALFGSGVYVLWRKTKISLLEKNILLGLLSAYFIQNLFVFDNLTSYIMFFTVLGYISYLGYGENFVLKKENNNSSPASLIIKNGTYIIVPVVLALLVTVLYFANWKPVLASSNLIKAISQPKVSIDENINYLKKVFDLETFGSGEAREQLVLLAVRLKNSNLPDNTKIELASFANDQMRIQVGLAPTDIRYHLYLGSLLSSYGAFDESLKYLKTANEISPHKQIILFELASTYINKGETTSALPYLKTAYEESPDFKEARVIYAAGLIYAGRPGEADILLKEANDPSVYSDPRIVGAYSYTRNK